MSVEKQTNLSNKNNFERIKLVNSPTFLDFLDFPWSYIVQGVD